MEGNVLYRFENGKQEYTSTKERFKRNLKSPMGIYLVVVVAFMTFWILYSLVSGLRNYGTAYLLVFLPNFFVYFVAVLILALSVGGLWSRFMRFALRKNLVKPRDRQYLEHETEVMEANEIKQDKANALYVYEDRVIVYDLGKLTEISMDEIYSVEITPRDKTFDVRFFKKYAVTLFSGLPSSDLNKFKKVFGEKIETKQKEKRRKSAYRAPRSLEFDKDKIGGLIMGFFAVGAGVAVICVHFYVTASLPWFLGAFFVMGGVVVMFTTLDGLPVVRVFIIPLLFGIFFTVASPGIAVIVTDGRGETLPIHSLSEFLQGCTPLYLGTLFLTAMGFMIIVISIVNLVKYIKYGEH